jgi:hypothetical protein
MTFTVSGPFRRARGIPVRLAAPSPASEKLPHITALDRSFTICATLSGALATQ